MPVFAAVDIGSNSVRLSIAELRRGRLVQLHQDREVTRLGEGAFKDGNLDPQAMARSLKVLRRFHRTVQSFAVERIRVVATSALRDSVNGRIFSEWVKSATGWNLEIISGLEEGRLIHLGLLASLRARVLGTRTHQGDRDSASGRRPADAGVHSPRSSNEGRAETSWRIHCGRNRPHSATAGAFERRLGHRDIGNRGGAGGSRRVFEDRSQSGLTPG